MSVWDRAADLFVAPLRAVVGSPSSWRPCAECEAAGGWTGEAWPVPGHSHGRPNQIAPAGDWSLWLIQAGRGFGKTRTGAEWMVERRLRYPGTIGHVAMPSLLDLRTIAFDGSSGITSVFRARGMDEDRDYAYNRTLNIVELTNGSLIRGFASEAPARARGPQCHDLWVDEPGTFADSRFREEDQLYPNLKFGHRLRLPDESPIRELVTGTPKRTKLVRELIARARTGMQTGRAVWVRGATGDNRSNLDPTFYADLMERYAGTALGAQELAGDMLDDVEGALWTLGAIDRSRVPAAPELLRRVVAVDPAASESPTGDAVGIIGAGARNGHGYVLGDWTMRGLPETWGANVVAAVRAIDAHAVVLETNFVGTWITTVLRRVLDDADLARVPIVGVHAGKGQTKSVRAEPVSLLYAGETPRVHHVGSMPLLEDEMTTWVPGQTKRSPNRIDALVWAMHDLLLNDPGPAAAVPSPAEYGFTSLPRW